GAAGLEQRARRARRFEYVSGRTEDERRRADLLERVIEHRVDARGVRELAFHAEPRLYGGHERGQNPILARVERHRMKRAEPAEQRGPIAHEHARLAMEMQPGR